jgi:hypothetical protein
MPSLIRNQIPEAARNPKTQNCQTKSVHQLLADAINKKGIAQIAPVRYRFYWPRCGVGEIPQICVNQNSL